MGKAVAGLRLGVGTVLEDGAIGEVRKRSVPFDCSRCKAIFIHSVLPLGEDAPQGCSLRNGGVGGTAGAVSQLTGHQRRQGGEGIQQPAVQRRVRRGAPQQGGELLLRDIQR